MPRRPLKCSIPVPERGMVSREDEYKEIVQSFIDEASRVEKTWIELPENAESVSKVPSAITSSAYRSMPWKEDSVPPNCPRCLKSQWARLCVVAGCRFNGDSYGSNLYMCCECGYTTYTSWDDA